MKKAMIGSSVVGATAAVLALSTLASVGSAGPDSTAPEAMSDALCLRKIALDLTYAGPTPAELAELESGAVTLGDLADRYMATPDFEQVVFDLYRQQFPPTEMTPDGMDVEEPSRIATRIVTGDRDYREMLTGTFTVDVEGRESEVIDRPAAGIMSTAHYMSAYVGSYRRNWAGHFLVEWSGIKMEAVSLPPEAEEGDLSPDSILSDPACAGCHGNEVSGIDFLAPFSFCYDELGAYDETCDPAVTAAGRFLTVEDAGLQGLGRVVTESKEFESVAVNTFFKHLFGRDIALEESDLYLEQVEAFRENGYRAKALIRNLVTSPQYCAR